jgi:hypothetical protein
MTWLSLFYIYSFLILRTPNLSSFTPGGTRTPGWRPLTHAVIQSPACHRRGQGSIKG